MSRPIRLHAFTDDVLAEHDAVALAALIRSGELSARDVERAAIARIEQVDPTLNAVAAPAFQRPRRGTDPDAPLHGVPTLVKDNTDVAGMPTNHGTDAFRARPASRDARFTRQYLATGMTVLGKSRTPEFGFNASTEFRRAAPTPNPWHTDYSIGASSGGAAALVATGAVPLAHANDGGGSIRIPAAAAGLVGLKPSRGRHIPGDAGRTMPLDITSEGVLSRSVRDTAAYLNAIEKHWRNPRLAPIGLVEGPARRRLRVGMLLESPTEAVVDEETRAAVERTARVLEEHGHIVTPIAPPVETRFGDDFITYWSLLAAVVSSAGAFTFARSFDRQLLDGLTRGLRGRFLRAGWLRAPGALHRLHRAAMYYARTFDRCDVILSPVVAHVTPQLGHLSPNVDFDELLRRLQRYIAFTPPHNVAGTPAISLPMSTTRTDMPLGVQLSAAHGDERTLLELAFALEEHTSWPRLRTTHLPTGSEHP